VTFVAHSTFDFIVVNNVVQYLDPTELNSLVGNVARMLAPGGRALLGNVPDRALRVVFAQRARASSRRSAAVRVAGYTAEWLSAQFTPNRPTPRLGYWHTRRAVTHAAADAKLTAEFFGCLLYWYRFSALLAPSELGSIGSGVHVVPAP
jgi:SAM-dependent methyltransferase